MQQYSENLFPTTRTSLNVVVFSKFTCTKFNYDENDSSTKALQLK